jgi:ribonuclease P protein component
MNDSEEFDQRLPKKEILRKRTELNEVFERGSIWSGSYMKCLFVESNRSSVGFVVSRRFVNAVIRNRAKRLMREVFRKKRHGIGSFKIVIMPKKQLDHAPFKELEKDFDRFIAWLNLGKNG